MTQWLIEQSLFSQKRIKLYFLGDNHEGHEQSNSYALRRTCDKIGKERNSYVILMGDLFEMAVKTKMTREQRIQTKHQLTMFLNHIQPVKKKIIAVIEGNHEQRIETIDYLKDALMPHLPYAYYLGYEGFINVRVNGFNTLIYLHHGNGTSQNPEHFVKKLIFQVGIGAIADVVAIGHIHQQYHNTYILPCIDGTQVKERVVHGIRTGTFLGKANYARIAGFGLSKIGGMVMELDTRSGDLERRITET